MKGWKLYVGGNVSPEAWAVEQRVKK